MKNCFVCKHVKWEDKYKYKIKSGITISDVFPIYFCKNISAIYPKTKSCEIASTCKDYIEKEIFTDIRIRL